ncbi:hydroxyacylglutathione hydrolase [Paracoccus luteus]|uniref:hydroxyacylglutathione hydrolase n=1 Tax=Paracoccus luteus TaxID=2508543 RepID=UPI00106F20EF|nr:hydroxyacylglutathione hydrolase [Paracoccus luteus]
MPATVHTIRCLSDNYAYLVQGGGQTVLVDAPEAGPILAHLDGIGGRLDAILLTHHHDDHIQAVPEIVAATGAQVWGNGADAHRLPPLDRALVAGETALVCGENVTVIDVPGHTVGHVAFHFPASRLVFTADSLMAMGCGRLFEGTAAQMWDSLSRLAALPDDTLVCSGHDYCRGNGAFALSVDPDNAALRARIDAVAAGRRPCSPATLGEEKATNPFLRAPELARPDESALSAFARLRAGKDGFRG